MKEETKKKIFKWEGWKKEIGWIIFFLFLFLIAFAYKADTQVCREMKSSECFLDCQFQEGIDRTLLEHPDWHLDCNYETRVCEVAGLDPLGDGQGVGYVLDMEFIQNDTNNTRENTSEIN